MELKNKNTVQIKLCGLMREEDIRLVNEVRPEYAGFILATGRRRSLTPQRMRELTDLISPGIRRVAVFLDQDPEWIAKLAREDLMDVIQLHGSEDEDQIHFLKETTGRIIIKAFRIETLQDARRAQQSSADYVLLDHGAGGSGEAFDWSLTEPVKREYFLAGGLTPENVAQALSKTRPMAVDVSSGVETDHKKDPEKIRRFVRAVRGI